MWFETANRQVAFTEYKEQEVCVSTVFLGLATGVHWMLDDREPFLFETMVFGGDFDRYMKQYCTWDEAVEGHDIICRMVQATLHKS